jgi:hypothetical protein
MPGITQALVNRYIKNAELVAESSAEHLAIQKALEDNAPSPLRRRRNPYDEKAERKVRSWRKLVLKEIRAALCTQNSRYKKHVSAVRQSGDVLILAIAAEVARKLGINIVVIAAMVAALLRMMFAMGISVFCKGIDAGLL